jgi:hypothetical protein
LSATIFVKTSTASQIIELINMGVNPMSKARLNKFRASNLVIDPLKPLSRNLQQALVANRRFLLIPCNLRGILPIFGPTKPGTAVAKIKHQPPTRWLQTKVQHHEIR